VGSRKDGIPLKLSAKAKAHLQTMNTHLADHISFSVGSPPDWKPQPEQAQKSLEAAADAWSELSATLKLTTIEEQTIFLADANRFGLTERALRLFAFCPKCEERLNGWASRINSETNRTTRIICLDCAHDEDYEGYARDGVFTTAVTRVLSLDYEYMDGEFKDSFWKLNHRVKEVINKNQETIRQAHAAYKGLTDVATVFGEQHGAAIQARSDRENFCSYRAKIGDIEILTHESAGRRLVTIEAKDNMITTICTTETPGNHGVQGVYGRAEAITEMVRKVICEFNVHLLVKSTSICGPSRSRRASTLGSYGARSVRL